MAGKDLWWVNNGDDVEVEWSEGDWWPAKVTEVFDYPEARTLCENLPPERCLVGRRKMTE